MPLTTTQRGYGTAHQKLRALLVPKALGTPCPGPAYGPRSAHCTGLMTDPKLMDLDHSTPLSLGGTVGDRVVCRPCNRGAGGRIGTARRAAKRRRAFTTREW